MARVLAETAWSRKVDIRCWSAWVLLSMGDVCGKWKK